MYVCVYIYIHIYNWIECDAPKRKFNLNLCISGLNVTLLDLTTSGCEKL